MLSLKLLRVGGARSCPVAFKARFLHAMAALNGANKPVLSKETPEDGVKIAKELAEEVREETG